MGHEVSPQSFTSPRPPDLNLSVWHHRVSYLKWVLSASWQNSTNIIILGFLTNTKKCPPSTWPLGHSLVWLDIHFPVVREYTLRLQYYLPRTFASKTTKLLLLLANGQFWVLARFDLKNMIMRAAFAIPVLLSVRLQESPKLNPVLSFLPRDRASSVKVEQETLHRALSFWEIEEILLTRQPRTTPTITDGLVWCLKWRGEVKLEIFNSTWSLNSRRPVAPYQCKVSPSNGKGSGEKQDTTRLFCVALALATDNTVEMYVLKNHISPVLHRVYR